MKIREQFRFALAAGLTLAIAPSAFAAGTLAGDTISNTASVDYEVGGIPQPPKSSGPVDFLVDRKINLTVDEANGAATTVVPGTNLVAGPLNKAVTFTVTNDSNSIIDIDLSATQQVGGAAPFGVDPDNFQAGALTIYLEDGTTPGYQEAEDTTAVTFLDEMAVDETRTVHIVGSIADTRVDKDVAVIILTGTAYLEVDNVTGAYVATATTLAADTAKTIGDADEAIADDTARIDTVLGDLAGVGTDVAEDGNHSDRDQFTVVTAKLVVTKSFTVISDPFSDGGNPKAIPGAVVEYCVAVENQGSADADLVAISDDLSALAVTFVSGTPTSIRVAVDSTANDCSDGTFVDEDNLPVGVTVGFAADTVNAEQDVLAAGDFFSLKFRVTVD